jgi:Na+-transporting methylmalonyl-CoA/oxaloacetate decarboxylase gamma subunit
MLIAGLVHFAAGFHKSAINKQASSSLFMNEDDVAMFLERHRERRRRDSHLNSGKSDAWLSASNSRVGTSSTLTRMTPGECHSRLDELAVKVRHRLRHHHDNDHSVYAFPKMFWRVFAAKCPWTVVLRYSLAVPATMNVMMLMVEVYSNFWLAALFFQASGGAMAEDMPADCEPADFMAMLGQIIAVGTVTVIIGWFPGHIFEALHVREFVTFKSEDDPEWEATLRLWRRRDRVIWFLAFIYTMWCIFFTLLFIANTTETDGMIWMMSLVISTAQATIGIPFVMTFLIISVTMMSMCATEVRQSIKDHLTDGDEDEEDAVPVAQEFTATEQSNVVNAIEDGTEEPKVPVPVVDNEHRPGYDPELDFLGEGSEEILPSISAPDFGWPEREDSILSSDRGCGCILPTHLVML